MVSIFQQYLPLLIKVLVGSKLSSFREDKKSSSAYLEVKITRSIFISITYESINESLKIFNGCVGSTIVRIGNVLRRLYY